MGTVSNICAGSGSGNLHMVSSLQDMRYHLPHPPTPEAKSSSAGSLHGHTSDSGQSFLLYTRTCAPLLSHRVLVV